MQIGRVYMDRAGEGLRKGKGFNTSLKRAALSRVFWSCLCFVGDPSTPSQQTRIALQVGERRQGRADGFCRTVHRQTLDAAPDRHNRVQTKRSFVLASLRASCEILGAFGPTG